MKILIIGGTGFIGRSVTGRLLLDGHSVTVGTRDVRTVRNCFPSAKPLFVDMNKMTYHGDWDNITSGIDCIINVAGILQSNTKDSSFAIHTQAPEALLHSARQNGVKKFVHISAITAEPDAETHYAQDKYSFESILKQSENIDWTILKPSFVYGSGSYGGSSLIRGLSVIPLVAGSGDYQFQPIHKDDLTEVIVRSVEQYNGQILDVVGPEVVTVKNIILKTRAWLNMSPRFVIHVPLPIVSVLGKVADIFDMGAMRSSVIKMMTHGGTGDYNTFFNVTNIKPMTMDEAFLKYPSHVQDRWHSKMYFLRLMMPVCFFLLWFVSGVTGLISHPSGSDDMLKSFGLPLWTADLFGIMDLVFALCWLTRFKIKLVSILQLLAVAGYTIGISVMEPSLWMEGYGILLKNIPIILLMMVWLAIRDEK